MIIIRTKYSTREDIYMNNYLEQIFIRNIIYPNKVTLNSLRLRKMQETRKYYDTFSSIRRTQKNVSTQILGTSRVTIHHTRITIIEQPAQALSWSFHFHPSESVLFRAKFLRGHFSAARMKVNETLDGE